MATNATVTYPYVAIQTYLTFTANRWGISPTITFTNGATAGSEIVTVDANNNITVQIQSGTSTMLQIKNAILAHTVTSGFSASDLVTVTITTGHNSDAVKTLVNATLSGGVTSATNASVTIGGLVYTAHTAGSSGNSLSVQYTAGATAGSEVVTDPSSGNPLTIQISDAGASQSYTPFSYPVPGTAWSTLGQVKAAIDTWQGSNTVYFDITYASGFDAGSPAFVSPAASAVSLAGGLDAAAASVAVQGITITSITNDATQNGATFSATTGGTHGSEVVTMSGNNISVQIQEGVSTVTEVRTALNNASGFSALYSASGTSSTPVRTVNADPMAGGVGPQMYAWEMDNTKTALTSSFVYFPFLDSAQDFFCFNNEASGSNTVIGSWDGINNHFILNPTQHIYFGTVRRPGIYLKYGTGAPAYMACTVGR